MQDRQVRVGCKFIQSANAPVAANFLVEPAQSDHVQVLESSWTVDPQTESRLEIDHYGNRLRRLVLPAGRSTCVFDALVTVPDEVDEADPDARQLPPAEIPTEYLEFIRPSRFCQSDVLSDQAWKLFGHKPADYRRVQDVVDFVHNHLSFRYGASDSSTSAVDAHANGEGVCRDFAQLAVTFCRALSIPTRYAFGYLPDIDVTPKPSPMDFAAWMEVYLDGRWFTFDPRNNVPRKAHIVIGRGRDAADVAMVTSFGRLPLESMTVVAREERS